MKKSKFLKPFSFASLALLIGAAGVFAFAPLGANPNNFANANTLSDEINTKADGETIKYAPSALGLDPENDPVIYTTESGLEIKFGGAITALGGGNEKNDFAAETLPSGKPLSGYPYFTMGTYNGYAVNWVIIGKSTTGIPTTSTSTGMSDYNYEKLSTWQGKTSESPTYKHFFEQTYDATTPAGAAIKNSGTLNNYAARKIEYMFNPSILSSIVPNSEIDAGCVLAISECCLGYSWFNCTSGGATGANGTTTASTSYGSRYRYLADNYHTSHTTTFKYTQLKDGTLYSYMNNLYSSTLGLTQAQQRMIVAQKLNTIYNNYNGSSIVSYMDSYSSDGNTLYNMFPLASKYFAANGTNHSLGAESFDIHRYITNPSLKVAYQIGTTTKDTYWMRSSDFNLNGSGISPFGCGRTNTDGTYANNRANNNLGVRPACVVKFV